ncbi:RcpC/CpaB family pilus assembly protein [Streptomyces desertarenae]|uniref:RcpC/CpaB family pilus assembly protein n=1 Tax=Streptomyces desertarenae TaxID=2666184 RepID=A0ABW4PF52_9ACTN
MPEFEPVRAGRGPLRLPGRAGRPARAAAVALSAVALAGALFWEPGGGEAAPAAHPVSGGRAGPPPPAAPRPPGPSPKGGGRHGDGATVGAPVRLPDAAVVRLLRPGDRVDVLAAPPDLPSLRRSSGVPPASARIVARGVRVAAVPGAPPGPGAAYEGPNRPDGAYGEAGALVVLSVSRSTAARIAGAAAHSRLVVTLC